MGWDPRAGAGYLLTCLQTNAIKRHDGAKTTQKYQDVAPGIENGMEMLEMMTNMKSKSMKMKMVHSTILILILVKKYLVMKTATRSEYRSKILNLSEVQVV